jgi:predicted  nucleic acid-binding Zn-ribbon protein
MTEDRAGSLKKLQELDLVLEKTRARIIEYEPLIAEVEEPALALERELEATRNRLQEMKKEERRLEGTADDRRARVKKLKERLKSVRNLREEAAVQAESDLLQRSLEAEEQEALSLLDQIRKLEERLTTLEGAQKSARDEVEPRRQELMEAQASAKAELDRLQEERSAYASRVPERDLRSYERIRGGGRNVAVATLTPDGACGNCFGIIPLQVQNEIRSSGVLIPCEACGVLLGPGEEDA